MRVVILSYFNDAKVFCIPHILLPSPNDRGVYYGFSPVAINNQPNALIVNAINGAS
ncbi:hypothetical protein [Williamwhitmania taraxaci]|uniref:hypothetical protein n=1 Tax=Williamwhitmania taraxaci TaxID=1640674 RepID=UPI001481284B|nr:hypothetical protein [Williamwhitmania taraxaci]